VDTNFVKRVLLNGVGILQTLYDEENISAADIRGILEYVANDAPLVGLPLLILSTGELVAIPGTNMSTVYVSSDPHMPVYFLLPYFWDKGIHGSNRTPLFRFKHQCGCIIQRDRHDLISSELRKFNTDDERNTWLAVLWDSYSSLPTPRSLDSSKTLA